MFKSMSIPAQYLETGADPKRETTLEQWFSNLIEWASESPRRIVKEQSAYPFPRVAGSAGVA